MVYGFDQNKANKFLCRNRLVVDKFLNQFVHIKGISRLFNERYVEFEWDMHSRINFTDHKISYYRDHYFHQLRDCFMLYRLLEDQKIYNKVSSILHEPTASKISRYFSVTLDRLTYNIYEDQQLYNVFLCRKFELYWNDELLEKVTKHIADSGIAFDCKISKICNFIKTNVIDQIASFSQKGLITTDKELVKILARYVSLPEHYVYPLNALGNEIYSDNDEFFSKLTEILLGLNLECNDVREYFDNNDNPIDTSNKQNRRTIVKEYIKYRIADGLIDRIYSVINKSIDSLIDISSEADDYFTRYIVFSTAIIASLFHDIGYPVVHFFGLQKRLQNFSSPIYMLINGDKSSYEKISSTLSQSLLFQIVGKEEIVDRCEKGDHGAFSSIILLLHYYESGLIFSLPLEQRTAIELASVAIYNHTNSFKVIEKKGKSKKSYYYKPIFKLNPISFLLRICDDAQEWERTYFEIGDTQSLLYCNKCKTPLIRTKNKNPKGYSYRCRCGFVTKSTKAYKSSKAYKINLDRNHRRKKYTFIRNRLRKAYFKNETTDFSRRIIYDVTPSDSLRVYSKDNSIMFRFSYNYFWLLRMCSINPTYTDQRIEELNDIKQLVLGQNIGYNINIEFKMSYNPILIKSWIVGKYAIRLLSIEKNKDKLKDLPDGIINEKEKEGLKEKEESFEEFIRKEEDKLLEEYTKKEEEELFKKLKEIASTILHRFVPVNKSSLLKNKLIRQLCLYLYIYVRGHSLTGNENLDDKNVQPKTSPFLASTFKTIKSVFNLDLTEDTQEYSKKILVNMIIDSLKQYYREKYCVKGEKYRKEFMVSSKSLLFDVNYYCDAESVENTINTVFSSDFYPDYYSDLYLFECMNNYILEKVDTF